MTLLTRRKILTGLLAAPVVVRAGLLMPVRPVPVSTLDDLVLKMTPIYGKPTKLIDPGWLIAYAEDLIRRSEQGINLTLYPGPRIGDATGQ